MRFRFHLLKLLKHIFDVGSFYNKWKVQKELYIDTEPQTRGSEVVDVGSANDVKATQNGKPRKPNHITVENPIDYFDATPPFVKANQLKQQIQKSNQVGVNV